MYNQEEHDKMSDEFNRKALLLKEKRLKDIKSLENIWHNKVQGKYLADAVFAANDGIITTFAVVAGVAGADLSPLVVIILGVANMLADSVSMALGNYLGKNQNYPILKLNAKKKNGKLIIYQRLKGKKFGKFFRIKDLLERI